MSSTNGNHNPNNENAGVDKDAANSSPNNNGASNNGANNNEPMFLVVRNHEEQYSIWPAGRDVPAGWDPEGTVADKDACLAHIAEVWTDMRPLSLRRRMELNHA